MIAILKAYFNKDAQKMQKMTTSTTATTSTTSKPHCQRFFYFLHVPTLFLTHYRGVSRRHYNIICYYVRM